MAAALAVSNRTAPIQANVRPRYFTPVSIGLLCLLVYANTALAFREVGLNAQLVVFGVLVSLWFAFVGFRIRSAVFAAVALAPATLIEGVGYFMLPGMALTLSDLFTLIAILMFLARPQPLQRNRFTTLLWGLFVVSFLSILLAANPTAHAGQFVRLGLSITFLTIILASPGDTLKQPFFFALLAWPFVVLAYITGLDYLWRFLTFGEGRVLNLAETGEVLLGSHLIILNLVFLVPLLVFLRTPRWLLVGLLPYLLVLIVFSYSRSLVIGLAAALLLSKLFMRSDKKSTLVKWIIPTTLAGGLVLGVASLGFFNFGADEGSKASSSYIRIAKIAAASQTYLDNPVMGIGYGAAVVVDGKRQEVWLSDPNADFLLEIVNVQASAESTPPQILAETGTFGGLMSLLILVMGFRHLVQILRSSAAPPYAKLALLALVVMFVAGFLGGNSYASVPFFMAMPFVFGAIRWRR